MTIGTMDMNMNRPAVQYEMWMPTRLFSNLLKHTDTSREFLQTSAEILYNFQKSAASIAFVLLPEAFRSVFIAFLYVFGQNVQYCMPRCQSHLENKCLIQLCFSI